MALAEQGARSTIYDKVRRADRIAELRRRGLTWNDIAAEVGLTPRQVRNILADWRAELSSRLDMSVLAAAAALCTDETRNGYCRVGEVESLVNVEFDVLGRSIQHLVEDDLMARSWSSLDSEEDVKVAPTTRGLFVLWDRT